MDCLTNTPFLIKLSIKLFSNLVYIPIILGSIGMMLFVSRFPLSSCSEDLKLFNNRLCGLNGYQVWRYSWFLIIAGTGLQFVWSLVWSLIDIIKTK